MSENRFSPENSVNEFDPLHSSNNGASRECTPTKPILVRRATNTSPQSSQTNLGQDQVRQSVVNHRKTGTKPKSSEPLVGQVIRQRNPPATAVIPRNAVQRNPENRQFLHQNNVQTVSERVKCEHIDQEKVCDNEVEVECLPLDQVNIEQTEQYQHQRPKSEPAGNKLHWDSNTKQWFTNRSIEHEDIPKPIEVHVFKLNVEEPKINRWITKPGTERRKPSHNNGTYDFNCSKTVELVNSLQKTTNISPVVTPQYNHTFQTPTPQYTTAQNTQTTQSTTRRYQGNPDIYTTSTYQPSEYSSVDHSHHPTVQQHRQSINLDTNKYDYKQYQHHPATTQVSQTFYPVPNNSSTMSLGMLPPDAVSKTHAKAELQALSNRLGNYIQYVREISENANQVDLAAFVNSISILEQELVNIKNLYERELGSSRQDTDDLSRCKNELQQESQKLRTQVAELESRLASEADKNRQAINEINSLQRTVMQKDREITEVKMAMQKPVGDLDLLTKEFNAVLREKEDAKRRWDHESLERQSAQDKNHQLIKKLDIDTAVHQEETRDLSDRLNAAATTILTLEAKIREMTHADTALAEMLQRVRSVAEAEIERYQAESEARFSQNVSELQSQLNEANRKISDLNDRNQQLHNELGDYQSANRALQGQVTSLEHQRRVLEEDQATDRQRSHDHIKLLEHKLVQLQDNIITKMRELNAARDAQVPLKAEIETLRSMLEEEEQRLRLPPSPRIEIPSLPQASAPSSVPGPNIMRPNFANSASVHDHPLVGNYVNGGNVPTSLATSLYAPPPQDGSSPRPLGPVRARSAPAEKSQPNYVLTSLGSGKDYFDEMFNDLRVRETRENLGLTNIVPHPPQNGSKSPSPTFDDRQNVASPSQSNDCTTYTSSATGDIRILEVNLDGKYIRLLNNAVTKEHEIGGYLIQQNVGGHPVAVFRFPPQVRVPSNSTVTVWAGSQNPQNHRPPSDFYFKEHQKWGTGPECTTIVCKPNGQAIAWTTASHRFSRDAFLEASVTDYDKERVKEELTEYNMNVNTAPREPVYLRREKEQPPSLNPQKHPHGVSPPSAVHPHTGQARPLCYGNDNSSVNRQTRGQSTRPDPIPGAPYAGASAQRMGSASLRKYNSPTIKGSGAIANRSSTSPVSNGEASRPPSSFQKPSARFQTGMEQLNSQYNSDYQPPMPRPPLFTTW